MSWSVYPIETIVAEKLHALISHGDQNSRSKDIHDLALFLPKANVEILKEAIKKCFEFRKTEVPINISNFLQKLDTTRLERGWTSATASVTKAPSFKASFEEILKYAGHIDKT